MNIKYKWFRTDDMSSGIANTVEECLEKIGNNGSYEKRWFSFKG